MAKSKDVDSCNDTKALELEIEDQLGRSIDIKYNIQNKSGTITIGYYSLDDLEKLSGMLGFKNADY